MKVLKHADVSVRGTSKVKDYGPYSILKEENDGGQKVADMTYSEIGSYFWLSGQEKTAKAENISWLPNVEDSCFAFSGRNAIDVALRDILKEKNIQKVYAPSYCCVSMLQSFIDRGLKVEFYDVGYQAGRFTYQLPKADVHCIVLIISYFGLNTSEAHRQIAELKKHNQKLASISVRMAV